MHLLRWSQNWHFHRCIATFIRAISNMSSDKFSRYAGHCWTSQQLMTCAIFSLTSHAINLPRKKKKACQKTLVLEYQTNSTHLHGRALSGIPDIALAVAVSAAIASAGGPRPPAVHHSHQAQALCA